MINASLTVDDIRAEAARLGFSLSGVTTPAPPPHIDAYTGWLARGQHAQMAYLNTERSRSARANPLEVFDNARSVVVLGMRYPDPRAIPDARPGEACGRVAAYAWGDDYHETIPARLAPLAELLKAQLEEPFQSKTYTDTGPVLERDLAQRAGLGWAGKNTCLISPHAGSYYLLAEIFTSAEILPGPALQTDLCGSCTRCIQACPTGCILPNRTIDAGRCISYLTIENKGVIAPQLRPKLADWIFGCDICQMVCPWNIRFSDLAAGEAFAPRADVPRPPLRAELRLTPQEFNRKFKNSPLRRAKRRGYLRNVAVALGNQPDSAALPDLGWSLLAEPEPLVRAHVAWALGQTGGAPARQVLDKALRGEPDPGVIQEIRAALAAN
jgi:epoxyqueuosine reductase